MSCIKLEWLGGAFDAVGNSAVYNYKGGARYVSMRVPGPASSVFYEFMQRGQMRADTNAYWASGASAYSLAKSILPYTVIHHGNLSALVEFHEIHTALGNRISACTRWNHIEELSMIKEKREAAYIEYIRKYTDI